VYCARENSRERETVVGDKRRNIESKREREREREREGEREGERKKERERDSRFNRRAR